jgi:gamma-glutamyltranspeptidase / glutathione hydrolase
MPHRPSYRLGFRRLYPEPARLPARLATLGAGRALCTAWVLAASPAADAASPAPAYSQRGMVVTSQVDATLAGVQMLEAGGNAVDAAVAAAFALGVTQPFSAGIGGGGFLLVRLADGTTVALDARETAPDAATRDMYVQPGVAGNASLQGALAVATPSWVAGLAAAQERFGTMPLARVMEPAIHLAEDGFPIGPYHARMIERMRRALPAERFPETHRIQFPPPGQTAEPGWVLRQTDLAGTLRTLAAEGPSAFYEGPIALAIAEEIHRRGGRLARADLEAYGRSGVKLRAPVRGRYRGYEVISFPPPSSGGTTLLEMLNILEGFDLRGRGAGSSASIHVAAEAMKLAFADRNTFLGDPDFVDVPVAGLVSKSHADALRARINPPWWRRAPWSWGRGEVAIHVEEPGFPLDDSGTTHLSATDADGNCVALTMTINTPYGSGITVPGTGIVLNNEMDDFSKAAGTPNVYGLVDVRGANAIEPRKRPLSSMTPTIVLREGRPFLVVGSPGGPRIITTTLLAVLNVIDWGMDVEAAVAAPRFHHQWLPDVLYLEPEVPADVVEGLRRRGHAVEVSDDHWSAAEAVEIDPQTGWQLGGSDPRRDGLAAGP